MNNQKEILQLMNVKKDYTGSFGTQEVLKDISLIIYSGEFVALTGDSGSGKTTLLNIIGGLDVPTSGKVKLLGENIEKLPEKELSAFRRQEIGFIFQDFNLLEELTVYENVIFSARLGEKEINEELIEKLLKKVGLWEKRDKFPEQLSGGEKQRTAILRSIISRPSLILADEPTGNLDENNTATVMSLLKTINKSLKSTIVMVTHNMDLAKQCGRVIRICNGNLEEDNATHKGA